jgi:hypothetical protein
MPGVRRRHAGPGLVVPAYFHPAVAPEWWEALAGTAAGYIRVVVVNVAGGPGEVPDPSFAAAVARLRAAGVRTAGYVDTAYGARRHADVLADLRRFRDWYRVDGVFLDQVSASAGDLPHYRGISAAARACGADPVVLNPGVHPAAGYAELGDLLVTFEGAWPAYRRLTVPAWARRRPAREFAHLVYGTPSRQLMPALRLADERHAGGVYVTDLAGANPWRGLPSYLPRVTAALRARRRAGQGTRAHGGIGRR